MGVGGTRVHWGTCLQEHGGYAHGHRQRRMGTDTESDSINSAKTDTENGTGAAKYYALRKIQKSI